MGLRWFDGPPVLAGNTITSVQRSTHVSLATLGSLWAISAMVFANCGSGGYSRCAVRSRIHDILDWRRFEPVPE